MKVVVFPRIVDVQWSNTVGSTLWGMVSGMVVVLDVVHGLAEIAPASCQLQQAVWSSLWNVQSSRRGAPWALQARVLRAPAVAGHAAVPDPPGRSAGAHTRRSGRHVEVPDPSRGGGPGLRPCVLSAPLWRGT